MHFPEENEDMGLTAFKSMRNFVLGLIWRGLDCQVWLGVAQPALACFGLAWFGLPQNPPPCRQARQGVFESLSGV